MNQTTYKINTDIVSTTIKDKPLIFISEEAINLKRDNDNLKSIIKEVRECINHYAIENEDYSKIYNNEEKELLEILDKADKEKYINERTY